MNRINNRLACLALSISAIIVAMGLAGCDRLKSDSAAYVQTFEDSLYEQCRRDSLSIASHGGNWSSFDEDSFVEFISSHGATLSHPFEKLQQVGLIKVRTSEDGNLRIYQWEEPITTRFGSIAYIIQYRTQSGEVKTISDLSELQKSLSDKDDGEFYLHYNNMEIVCSEQNNQGHSIYVIDCYTRVDAQYGIHVLAALQIAGDTLEEYMAFEDSGSTLLVEYEGIADWYFRTSGLGWEWVNSYDKANRAIYVPNTVDSSLMTDRYNVYQFDGELFKLAKVDGGYWLNPKLRNFDELVAVFKTKDYIIRVDDLGDGTYRYVSWGKEKSMLHEPDLELTTEKYDVDNNCLFFYANDPVKGKFEYIVDDGSSSTDKGLTIKRNGKVILSQAKEF